ncbi:zinc-binding dehydrogenase [Staphylococcus sp. GDB8P25P]|uniref:zinc-binding dehydrogenase n=1 Tax=Staphylococcus sp. GDB8P25P TaxID=2804446 RepID=UPI0019536FB4|nr:zinc-binding dehydrogenase [Staphylococcus sp. GDB8P25P]
MKGLVKTQAGFGHLALQEQTIAALGDDEIKIKVHYAGVCGTDIHTYEGHYNVNYPVTLGHEFAGEIVELGNNVEGFNIGDRVTSETTYYICGQCQYCATGDYNLCSKRRGLGTQQDGAFAPFVIARAASVHRLPDNVTYQAAAMTEPLACAHHAVAKIDVKKGDKAVIMGPGPIGLLVAQVVKSKGAEIIITGLDNDQARLDKAAALQLDHVVNLQHTNLQQYTDDLTSGYGVDIVIECSGAVPAANQGLSLLRKKGNFVQLGIFKDDKIEFDMDKVIQKEITVVGSRSQKPADWEPSLQLLSDGSVNAETLVTKILNISEWDTAYQHIKSGEGIKVLLKPVE